MVGFMRKTLLLLMIFMFACRSFADDEITVAAAADLNYALNQLASRFEATSGTKVAAAGIADASSLRIYALGHLVLWVPNNSPFDPEKLQMEVLTQPAVTRVAIANPQHAPYGRAAMAALQHFGLKDKVAGKLVFGENISQAAQFVQSGNAQAGLIAMSLAKSPAMV